ncbi:DNA damage-regulated autophagy modulator protein 2 [Halotydeus destructor]|nr:DNA damage-regulated autophagy modulator protein 2 [Halotydeus destructor]
MAQRRRPLGSRVHWLPISVALGVPFTFIITYVTALFLGHVQGFPYISDTGKVAPESSFFSLLINLVCVLFALTIFVRYKQIQQYYRQTDPPHEATVKILARNYVSLYLGMLAIFGLMILANFRSGDVAIAHQTGALVCFLFGPLYCWYQTNLSYLMEPLVNSRAMAHVRLTLVIIMTITFLISLVCGLAVGALYDTKKDIMSDGQVLYINSTVNEWVTAITMDLFILTFAGEMHKVSLALPECHLVSGEYDRLQANSRRSPGRARRLEPSWPTWAGLGLSCSELQIKKLYV